ncbi:hypothetical protein GCK72_004551 [Caenorhabditis remanei]|uniref:Uncharacterized protein n=1 Tax=Caenorhabditis remanei TaxID=31234 RepID=A0A6A5HE71_CAERE|nr:hypothetical protein GCK72_004551 [Caenorhabditis remanei]KAF1764602.1 hypothetical protein GCK72_004551 [Caenorhabditis remanei]
MRKKYKDARNTLRYLKSSLDLPFLLEISPKRLEIPSEGVLEVTIKNPTNDTQDVYCQFDSFYFLVDFKTANPWGQQGDTLSAAYGLYELAPGESCRLTIGYENGRYPEFEWGPCNKNCGLEEDMEEEMKVMRARMESKGNIYYNCDRPEGYLRVMHKNRAETRKDVKWAVREEQLHLVEETEKYQELKKKYLKIREDQKRRTRWGEVLRTNKFGTHRIYKKDDDLEGYVPSNELDFWERVMADKTIPKDLEEFDGMSDEEVQKAKMEKRKEFFETDSDGDERLKVELMMTEIEDAWGKHCRCEMPEHYTKKVGEGYKDPRAKKLYVKKKPVENDDWRRDKPWYPAVRRIFQMSENSESSETPDVPTPETPDKSKSQNTKSSQKSKTSETSKTSEESEIPKKSVEPHKSPIPKSTISPARPSETISEEKPRKAAEVPQPIPMSVTTTPEKKIVETKKMVVEKKKKKKKNPCCSIC